MKDVSDIPFWGKQKPLRHYFKNASLSFSVKDDKLFCKVTLTTKSKKMSLYSFEVENKEHLQRILKNEMPMC